MVDRGRWLVAGMWCLLVLGCGEQPPATVRQPSGAAHNANLWAVKFNPSATGTISGRVIWHGTPPNVPKLAARTNMIFQPPWGHALPGPERTFTNPNAPRVDQTGNGIGGTAVFLRHVATEQSKPWPHGDVTAVYGHDRIQILQNSKPAPVGFVRVGKPIRVLSSEKRVHIAKAKGAAFFSLTLPKPRLPRERRAVRSGVVELTSGMAYFWLRGYVLALDHSYCTWTDNTGRFQLTDVPPGKYELVAWLPNWHKRNFDYDPEQGSILRLHYKSPVEQTQAVHIQDGQTTTAELAFQNEMFNR